MTLEYVRTPSSGFRPNLIECPVEDCHKDLSGGVDTADHFWIDHLPEDFGLAPLGVIDPDYDPDALEASDSEPALIADGGFLLNPINSDGAGQRTQKDSEFICERCHSRCTESPVDSTEYGHRKGCPNRPDIDRYVNGPPYQPEEDPYADSESNPDQQVLTDGGDRRVD